MHFDAIIAFAIWISFQGIGVNALKWDFHYVFTYVSFSNWFSTLQITKNPSYQLSKYPCMFALALALFGHCLTQLQLYNKVEYLISVEMFVFELPLNCIWLSGSERIRQAVNWKTTACAQKRSSNFAALVDWNKTFGRIDRLIPARWLIHKRNS